jgi:hypothetical protein
MAPSRVDPNRKEAKSSIDQVEEDSFCFDRLVKTVSAPSQATVLKEYAQVEGVSAGFRVDLESM